MELVKNPRKIKVFGFFVAIGLILSLMIAKQVSAADEDFQIGVFWVPPAAYTNETHYDYLQQAHINWIINVASTDLNTVEVNKQMLELAAERGMKAVVADSRFDKVYDNTATDAEIAAMVNDYKGLPGLGGYYVMDEPLFENITYAGHAYQQFLQHDPVSVPYLNLLPYVWNKPEYEDYVDQIIEATPDLKYLTFDNYPFRTNGTTNFDILDDYYTNLKIIREKGLAHNLKTGAYIQAAGYFDMRRPLGDELRYNVFTSLAYGMKALYWFPYWHPGVPFEGAIIHTDGTKTDLYEPFQNLNAQIEQWGPTLMKLNSEDVYHSGVMAAGTNAVPADFFWKPENTTDNVIISYFTDANGRKYIMAVNRDYANTATLSFHVNSSPTTIKEISKVTGNEVSTNYNASTGVISAEFAPGEGRLYALPTEGMGELLVNPGFEDGLTGWTAYNPSTLTSVTDPVKSGANALEISARSMNYTGAMQDIKSILLSNGQGTYDFGAMLRTKSEDTQTMYANIFINDSTGDHYFNGSFVEANNGEWVLSSGSAYITWTGVLNYARIYTESEAGTGIYYVDDFSLKKPDQPAQFKSTLSANMSSITSGTEFKVSFGLNDITHPVYAQDINLDYNPAVMEFVSAKSLKEGVKLIEVVKAPTGKLRLIIASEGPEHAITGNAPIIELTFKSKKVSQTASGLISILNAMLADVRGNEYQADAASVAIEVMKGGGSGDINEDGKISIGDLALVSANYGKNSNSSDWQTVKNADINGDGIIDILDLSAIAKKLIS
ncbi:carbohydrate binding domain-containing protein [Paenibacillus luteus]|uniref:carbohydrate binding domain-containing protein n=1 Tax=Paenibacillus luteus TaxID=2545753 RepID=UPI001141A38D|nr:carbohydrate binding domain-containing protein [Paenibacillus luteus]